MMRHSCVYTIYSLEHRCSDKLSAMLCWGCNRHDTIEYALKAFEVRVQSEAVSAVLMLAHFRRFALFLDAGISSSSSSS